MKMVMVVMTTIMTTMSNFEFPQKQTLRQAWLQVDYWGEGDPGKYYNGMGNLRPTRERR